MNAPPPGPGSIFAVEGVCFMANILPEIAAGEEHLREESTIADGGDAG